MFQTIQNLFLDNFFFSFVNPFVQFRASPIFYYHFYNSSNALQLTEHIKKVDLSQDDRVKTLKKLLKMSYYLKFVTQQCRNKISDQIYDIKSSKPQKIIKKIFLICELKKMKQHFEPKSLDQLLTNNVRGINMKSVQKYIDLQMKSEREPTKKSKRVSFVDKKIISTYFVEEGSLKRKVEKRY